MKQCSYDGTYTLHYKNSWDTAKYLFSRVDLLNAVDYRFRYETNTNGERVFSEFCTADWWYTTQMELNKANADEDSTLLAIIIASDATQLTAFSGNQKAWPVYMQIGNHTHKARRTYSNNTTEIIGTIL